MEKNSIFLMLALGLSFGLDAMCPDIKDPVPVGDTRGSRSPSPKRQSTPLLDAASSLSSAPHRMHVLDDQESSLDTAAIMKRLQSEDHELQLQQMREEKDREISEWKELLQSAKARADDACINVAQLDLKLEVARRELENKSEALIASNESHNHLKQFIETEGIRYRQLWHECAHKEYEIEMLTQQLRDAQALPAAVAASSVSSIAPDETIRLLTNQLAVANVEVIKARRLLHNFLIGTSSVALTGVACALLLKFLKK